MRLEIESGKHWIELDGDIIIDSSMPKEEAEAYITESIRDQAIEESMIKFVDTISGAWTAHNNCEADDIGQSVWLGLLKFRDDRERWNIRYLKSKAVHLARDAIKTHSVQIVENASDALVMPDNDWSDLYDLIDSVKNKRQRSILKLKAQGMSPAKIGEQLNLTVAQVRTALSKGLAELKIKLCNMTEERRKDLRSLCS